MYEFLFNNRYDQSLVRILEIIAKDLSVESTQQPNTPKDRILDKIAVDLKNKSSFALLKNDVVFYLTPDSPWVARLSVFTVDEGIGGRQRLKAATDLTRFIFNQTTIEKIYGVTANPKFIRMAKYCKWKPGQEGIFSKSYYTNDGKLIDQVIISVNKSEFMKA